MIRLVQGVAEGSHRPETRSGDPAAIVRASWEFHPPGVVRLVTPAEQTARERGAASPAPSSPDATGAER